MKSEQELRELDAFCAEFVMGWKLVPKILKIQEGCFATHPGGDGVFVHDYGNRIKTFAPTTNPADALAVLKKCSEKMGEVWDDDSTIAVQFVPVEEIWRVQQTDVNGGIRIESASLELAICLFAKALFSK